jgi:hypothetical protein
MGNQIYFKIAGYVDLAVMIILTPCQISVFINVFFKKSSPLKPLGQFKPNLA